MPVPALASIAKDAGKSLSDAERYYNDAKDQRKKDTGKSDSALDDSDYKYIMGVVKKRLGLKTEQTKRSEMKTAREMINEVAGISESISMSDVVKAHNKVLVAITNAHEAIVDQLKLLLRGGAKSSSTAVENTHEMLELMERVRKSFERGPKPPKDDTYRFMDIK